MKRALRARTVFQKVTLMATAFVLAVASLTASVPFILSQNAAALSMISTSTDPQGWSAEDGHAEIVAGPSGATGNGSLKLTTVTESKQNYYHTANVALSGVSGLGYKLSDTAGIPASYQLKLVNVTGAKGWTTLVWEPVYNGGSNGPTNGFVTKSNLENGTWWSSNAIDGAPNRDTFVSLSTIIAANPNALVVGYGVNVGSGTPNATSYVDDVSFMGDTTNFEVSAPTLAVTSPIAGDLYGGLETHSLQKKTITVNATASDVSGLGAYCVKITKVGASEGSCVSGGYFNSPANGTMPSVNINTTTLTSGDYVVKARITNKAGIATEQTRSITVDNTKPVLSTPIANGQTFTNSVDVTLNADEAHPKIYNIRVLDSSNTVVTGLYDANANSNTATLNWNTRTVNNGTYTIQFSARDAVGNSAVTIFRTVTINNDYDAPVVTIDGLNNASGTPTINDTTGTPTITGTIDDPNANVFVTIDSTDYPATNNGNGSWIYKVATPLSNGSHTFAVYALDQSNNQYTTQMATLAVAKTSSNNGGAVGNQGGSTTDPSNSNTPVTAPVTPSLTAAPNGGFPLAVGTQQVLGDSTSNTTNTNPTGAADVKGTSTQKTLASALPDSSNGSVWGLAWYWWLLILAAIATIIWWIIAAVRNRQAQN